MSTVSNNAVNQVSPNEYEFLRLQKDTGSEIIKNIQEILRDEDINFTEDLSNSFSLTMWQGKAYVATRNPYARFVDWGLREGTWVNFDALYDWVRIKLNIEEPYTEGVTWKIMKKIQKNGIKPKRFVKKALKKLIGDHGVTSLRRTSGGKRKKKVKSKMRHVNSINRVIRKVRKVLNTINSIQRSITSPTRIIRRRIQQQQNTNNSVMRKVIKSERQRGNII